MKTVIITGGNSGLGYHCAQQIAQNSDWQIMIACRNLNQGSEAIQKLQTIVPCAQIKAIELDLADLDSIESFVTEFQQKDIALDALVCNAGVQFIQSQTYTKDGFEMTFGVNHLGHFALINSLLEYMTKSSRIILVSSDTHDSNKTTGMPAPYFRDPQLIAYPEKDHTLQGKNIGELGRIAYTTSKLCNLLCAYELDRRIKDTELESITVNVFNPGLMPGSGLAQDYTPIAKFVWHNILPWLSYFVPNVNTMENAGKALARLVCDRDLEGVSGKYFSGFKMVKSSPESYDQDLAKQLWDGSAELTNISTI